MRLRDQSLDSIGQSFHMSEIDYTFGVLIHPRARQRALASLDGNSFLARRMWSAAPIAAPLYSNVLRSRANPPWLGVLPKST